MLTAFQKLEKILRLEESQGYKDRAVIGGFAKFARIWQAEAQADAKDTEEAQAAGEIADILAEYGEAEVERRMQIVRDILQRLQGTPEPEEEPEEEGGIDPGGLHQLICGKDIDHPASFTVGPDKIHDIQCRFSEKTIPSLLLKGQEAPLD